MTDQNDPGRRPALLVIGGGGGVSQVLLGARPYFSSLAAAIAVTDTGRSTGAARALADMPAPGDLRNTLGALAHDPDGLMARLLQYRFSSPDAQLLDGMAFGNLLIAALTQLTGDFGLAIETVSRMVDATARIMPISTVNTQLRAELTDGRIMEDELAVRGLNKAPISRLYLSTAGAATYPPVLEAIAAADIVVLGPGSFFTSVMAALLFEGLAEALHATRARVVFVCNTTTQPGQTDGCTIAEHVRHLVGLLGRGAVDIALINRSDNIPEAIEEQYRSDGVHLLRPTDEEIRTIAELGVMPLVRDFAEVVEKKRTLWNKVDTIRHDPALLGKVLREIADDR